MRLIWLEVCSLSWVVINKCALSTCVQDAMRECWGLPKGASWRALRNGNKENWRPIWEVACSSGKWLGEESKRKSVLEKVLQEAGPPWRSLESWELQWGVGRGWVLPKEPVWARRGSRAPSKRAGRTGWLEQRAPDKDDGFCPAPRMPHCQRHPLFCGGDTDGS